DSVRITLNPEATLESRILFRYFERGEFRLREFSETPRDKNIEAFVRTLCVIAPSGFAWGRTAMAKIGIGARVYILTQEPTGLGTVRAPAFVNRSFAPETLVELDFYSGTTLRLNGWYEFQFDNRSLLRSVPNILLSVNLPFVGM
ncbi:MAG: hypothetical protein JNN25_17490, partial [Candidatus Kapabacteria bacterium]|nr:hypothetical protein [Candidatus Kapabacteria bacterium]